MKSVEFLHDFTLSVAGEADRFFKRGQQLIDDEIAKHPLLRAHIRPSVYIPPPHPDTTTPVTVAPIHNDSAAALANAHEFEPPALKPHQAPDFAPAESGTTLTANPPTQEKE